MSALSTSSPSTSRARRAIRIEDVTKSYGSGETAVHALRGITLNIDHGEFVAIMGASGSGKSTLMNILGCLDVPTSGRYELDGTDVQAMREAQLARVRNQQIGFVFQSFNLVKRTSALANVELPLVYARRPKAERRAMARAALESVGLSDRARHMPSELSGGQQQRVAVARALVTDPAIVLADEPTGNLDSVATSDVLDMFAAVHAQGRTIVLITHETEVAERAHRIIRLADGHIIEDRATTSATPRGTPSDAPPPTSQCGS